MAKYDFIFRLIEFPFASSLLLWPTLIGGIHVSTFTTSQFTVFGLVAIFFAASLAIIDPIGYMIRKMTLHVYRIDNVSDRYKEAKFRLDSKRVKEKQSIPKFNTEIEMIDNRLSDLNDEVYCRKNHITLIKKQREIEKIKEERKQMKLLTNSLELGTLEHNVPFSILSVLSRKYIRHGLDGKSISVEIDKLVSMIYFLIIATTLTISLIFPTFDQLFDENIINNLNNTINSIPNCELNCVSDLKSNTGIIIGMLIILVSSVGISVWRKRISFYKNVRTASIYIMALHNKHHNIELVDKLHIAIEQRKWEIAESLSHSYIDMLEQEYDEVSGIFKFKDMYKEKSSEPHKEKV